MDNSYHIPDIMEELFLAWVPAPDSGQWPVSYTHLTLPTT